MDSTLAKEAVTRATLEVPYFSSALWAINYVALPEDKAPPMAAIDEKWRLYYCPETWADLSIRQRMALVLHEMSHVLRRHFQRAKSIGVTNADAQRWNVACDLEINTWIQNHSAFDLPEGGQLPEKYGLSEGLLAEEYFAQLPNPPQDGGKGKGEDESNDCGSGAHGLPRPWEKHGEGRGEVTPASQRGIEQSTKAAMQGQQAGTLPGEWEKWAEVDPDAVEISWQEELAQAIRVVMGQRRGMVDYSYRYPNRRQSAYGRVIMPAMVAPIPNVAIVQDTSGSMSPDMLAAGYTQVVSILKALGQPVTFIEVDAEVQAQSRITTAKRQLKGGGGTDMGVGIAAAKKAACDLLVVITDGYTPWPDNPRIKTIVLMTASGMDGPEWAKTISIR